MSELTIVRRIAARPSIVWEAITTPAGLRQWMGPDAGPVLVAQSDPRVGGHFRIRFRMLDGSEHECHGEYRVVEPPHRLVMSWQWASDGSPMTRVEIVLHEIDGGTELVFTHSQLPGDTARDGHRDGWNGALDKLQAVFAKRATTGGEPRLKGADAP
jgi:uncharacterized protein YndB with AHSA1/START domain